MSKKKAPKKSLFWQAFKLVQFCLFFGIASVVLFFFLLANNFFGELPSLKTIENPDTAIATEVYADNLKVLGTYYEENRVEVPYDELSQHLVHALVSTEDKRFYTHAGIDLHALIRAVAGMGSKGGGSTLSQQTAKNLFHDADYSSKWNRILQKLKEWVMAVRLERTFTKQEILAIYLNTVDFTYNSYGIKSASRTYFNKQPNELNIEEAAMLIAMLKAPTYYNPKSNPENAIQRRNVVLKLMQEQAHITVAQKDSLQALPLLVKYKSSSYSYGLATYFRDRVRLDVTKILKEEGLDYNVKTDGLKIYTTLNPTMQLYAEQAVEEHLTELQKAFFKEWNGREPWKIGDKANPELIDKKIKNSRRYKALKESGKSHDEVMEVLETPVKMNVFTWNGPTDTTMSAVDSMKYYAQILQVGFMAVDPRNGHVKAWVGGTDFRYFQLDHINTKRQVGSTIKPFLYSAAFDNGFHTCDKVPYESPYAPKWDPRGTKKWQPGELVEIQEGLMNSDNKVTAQVLHEVGGPGTLIKKAEALNIKSKLSNVPAICLGVDDISLNEMVGAYTAYANNGVYSKPIYITRIEDKHGNLIVNYGQTERKKVLSEREVFLTLQCMKGVVKNGTGRRLGWKYKFTAPIAGKTGTTQSNSDGWFIGLTPQLIAGAWVGCDEPSVTFKSTNLGQGANAALPIWALFYKKVWADESLNIDADADFIIPPSVKNITLDCNAALDSTYHGSQYEGL